ncbi:hypothetical protein AMK33_14170 [Streptomyces sp. CB02400]|nr:hypothetical protein AMK33_14170 [Streptomyces sp. CB02400]
MPAEQSADEQPDHVLMTMSVSRDGGRTWSKPIEVMSGDDLPPRMTSTCRRASAIGACRPVSTS